MMAAACALPVPLTARRIIVTRNQAFGDGAGLSAASGIGIEAGPLELRSSIVSLNVSDGFDGGGLDAGASERGVLIERSIIITNSAEILGGGIALPSFTSGDRPRLDEVIVYGNAATGPGAPRGAGVYASAGADVDQSWIGHNLAGSWGAGSSPALGGIGGGAWLGVGDHVVTNTTIEGNLAQDGGGVGSSSLNGVSMTHVTIARNRATNDGGGIFLFGDPEVELENVILAENEPSNCGGFNLPESASQNLADDESCQISGFGDVEDTDAQLGTLGYYGGFDALPFRRCPGARPSRPAAMPGSMSTSAAWPVHSRRSSTRGRSSWWADAPRRNTRVASSRSPRAATSTATAGSTSPIWTG